MKHLKTILTGKEQGDSLIVIHGWAMNSAVWTPIKSALESRYKVIWVDLPGHGINRDVVAHSLDEIVDSMVDLIADSVVDLKLASFPSAKSTSTKNIHLLGWSLGGLVAQALAKKNPQKIKSMTLVATTPRFSQTDTWTHAMSHEVLTNFAQSLQNDSAATIKRFIALQFMGIKDSKELQRTLTKAVLLNLADAQALKIGLEILTTADFREVQNNIPQHWILAGRDRLIPKSVINDLKLIRPDAQISLLENSGHAPFMTHPKAFISCFLAFMDNYA